MITEIDEGVFSAPHSIAEGKNAMVFGRRGALAIDCGLLESEGQAMAGFIKARNFAADKLALTHCHNDHILGGKAFGEAVVFAHANAPAVIQRHLGSFARYWKISETETSRRLLRPTVLFKDDLAIDLGERVVRFIHTPGHCEDHVSAYLEKSQVLIAGDVVVNSIIPAFMDGDSRVLEATLLQLKQMPIKKLLPGHGTLVDGEANVREALDWTIGYLRQVRERVRAAIADGGGLDAAVAVADYGEIVGDRLPRDKMQQRHLNSVKKIFTEEAGARPPLTS
jgi:glyoxylase-like metal-dependent hydrolase (beta-lactamase superfamily II)